MSHILVVDDSAVARKIIAKSIRADGYEIREASDGKEALALMHQLPPDLVITDLVMPTMDGLQLVKECRRYFPSIPVILVTSYGSEGVASEALREGAASYVPKSLLERDLRTVAVRLLMISQGRRSRERLFGRLQKTEFVFALYNEVSVISPLVSLMREALAWMGICTDAELNRVGVAVDEAVVNAMVHGNLEVSSKLRDGEGTEYHDMIRERSELSPYKDRVVNLKATFSAQEAVFVVRDEGPGFNHRSLPDPSNPENLASPSGRGVMLMKVFMDQVHFNDKGNEVTLVKRRST